ncbi:MAG: M23 family metallopeptidase, partial [bacterium]|nr:M23 family metallopeptidase [bacterium]
MTGILNQNRIVVPTILAACIFFATGAALAQGYEPAHSLQWPLLSKDTGIPRATIWSSMGEYQRYTLSSDPDPFMHSGTDFRGDEGDHVVVVADGNIWLTAQVSENCMEPGGGNEDLGWSCRLYILGEETVDHQYIYYYSHLAFGPYADANVHLRQKILNATQQGEGYDVAPDTDVTAGEILTHIGAFGETDDFIGWQHLHFGIVDKKDAYDVINPLTALERHWGDPVLLDEEDPSVNSLVFYEDQTTFPPVSPEGDCNFIEGNLDIISKMEDTYSTIDPVPEAVSGTSGATSIGVYEARYIIRNVETDVAESYVWYRFDRAPIRCPGPDRGDACAYPEYIIDEDSEFYDNSIDTTYGALRLGEQYSPVLYSTSLSSSSYTTNEIYAQIMTNTWGEEGSWNTNDYDDGVLYQVSVEAADEAGNKASMSTFVVVNNSGMDIDPDATTPDSYVRDNIEDIGAVPSTLGGLPFWKSPDIIVVEETDPDPPAYSDDYGLSSFDVGTTYKVFVRVGNDHCATVNNISTRVYSANPSMIIDETQWEEITGGTFEGNIPTLPMGGRDLLGPFYWTPSFSGHRCLLAQIDADNDSIGPDPDNPGHVKDNNNLAQRNIQVEGYEFTVFNPELVPADIQIEFDCNEFPIYEPRAIVRLLLQYHPAIENAWANVPGTTLTSLPDTQQL